MDDIPTMREKTRKINDFIINNVNTYPRTITKETTEKFNLSRQAVNKHLQKLVSSGVLDVSGTTRNRSYKLKLISNKEFILTITPELAEDRVWREYISNLTSSIDKNIEDICNYGFTEMFNNVLDHSMAKEATIQVSITAATIEIWVIDDGIGIFNKIQNELNLEDPRHAIIELAKGKFTTDPERHTGEGIFFTSRMFDHFSILSGALFFSHEEREDDWLVEDHKDEQKGTAICMIISLKRSRNMKEVFDKYTSELEDFGFTKTHVPVDLLRYGKENLVSRSQAKRLLTRFDRFKEVFLDFQGVNSIGKAFADEIFRVFKNQNPQIELIWIRATAEVEKVIKSVLGNP